MDETTSVELTTNYSVTLAWGVNSFVEKGFPSNIKSWYPWILLYIYVIMIVGLILNSITLIAYIRSSILVKGKPAHQLIFNIMVSDLLTTLATQPFLVFYYTASGESYIRDKKYSCILAVSTLILSYEATFFAILLFTFERLFAVASPLHHMHRVTKKICQVAICIMWMILVIKNYSLFFWNVWKPGLRCLFSVVSPPVYIQYIHNPVLYGSLGLILLGNSILGGLMFASKDSRAALKGRNSKKMELLRELKMVRMLFIVVAALYLSWLPHNIIGNKVMVHLRRGGVSDTLHFCLDLSRGWVVAGTVLDPLVYIWQNHQCLKAVKDLFHLNKAVSKESTTRMTQTKSNE